MIIKLLAVAALALTAGVLAAGLYSSVKPVIDQVMAALS